MYQQKVCKGTPPQSVPTTGKNIKRHMLPTTPIRALNDRLRYPLYTSTHTPLSGYLLPM